MITKLLLVGVCAAGSWLPLAATAAAENDFVPLPLPAKRVVLVHGFLERGSSFKPLKQRLEQRGLECLVPRLRPADARSGIECLARLLKEEIDREFGPDEPVALVGFSMGGLVSRYYLQHLGGAERCTTLITLSSPHHGTAAAHLYFGEGARQMRPGSDFLAALQQSEGRLGAMPVVSYRTPLDLVILPAGSSVWRRAENQAHPVLLHPLMLWDPAVLDDIERRLAGLPRDQETLPPPMTSFTRPAIKSAKLASPSSRRKLQ
jgi:triacylglycerol lipase